MGRTVVQLTPRQHDELRKRAKEQHVSMAELIRQAVDASLEQPSSHEERRRRALAVVGCFNSGTGDLGEKHDEYFAASVVEP